MLFRSDAEREAGDRAEGDGIVEPPAFRPGADASGAENPAEGEDDDEPPVGRSEPDTETEQAAGGASTPNPSSPRPEQKTADPKQGYTRAFPSVGEFLAFAKAALRQ